MVQGPHGDSRGELGPLPPGPGGAYGAGSEALPFTTPRQRDFLLHRSPDCYTIFHRWPRNGGCGHLSGYGLGEYNLITK